MDDDFPDDFYIGNEDDELEPGEVIPSGILYICNKCGESFVDLGDGVIGNDRICPMCRERMNHE